MKLNPLFSDGAVFQRDQQIAVWGRTAAGDLPVQAELAGKKAGTVPEKRTLSDACADPQPEVPGKWNTEKRRTMQDKPDSADWRCFDNSDSGTKN